MPSYPTWFQKGVYCREECGRLLFSEHDSIAEIWARERFLFPGMCEVQYSGSSVQYSILYPGYCTFLGKPGIKYTEITAIGLSHRV